MDALEAIFTRRSIRSFTDEPVTDEELMALLAAAMAAPSAGNAQPWRFVVVRDRDRMREVTQFHPYCKMILKAQAAILVCGDLSSEKHPGYWVQDCAAATQNLLLAARVEGLGAVWTGIYPDQARVDGCRRLFALPEHILPLALVPIGRPAEEKARVERFDPGKIRYEAWLDNA